MKSTEGVVDMLLPTVILLSTIVAIAALHWKLRRIGRATGLKKLYSHPIGAPGVLQITVPALITVDQARGADWADLRRRLLDNVRNCYELALDQIEEDFR